MTRLAYFDLAGGLSGDMAIAALAAAGRRLGVTVEAAVHRAIRSLHLGCHVAFVEDERGRLACLRAEITSPPARLDASELRAAIVRAALTERGRARALAAFDALVEAEARVHGGREVKLHELATADTAADLAGAAAALDALNIDRVAAAPVPIGWGWVESEHGALPLPAPAVLELIGKAAVRGTDATTELVTPTGAAVLRGCRATFGPVPPMTLLATGVGGGARDTPRPNVCRVLVGHALDDVGGERCVLLECNVDDQTPQSLGHVLEMLVGAGALDAWVTPTVMKRSRPAFVLSVLVLPENEASLTELVFRETTTLGLRRHEIERSVLAREMVTVRVRGGSVRVKVARLGGAVCNVAPEFSDCAALAAETGVAVKEIVAEAGVAARALLRS